MSPSESGVVSHQLTKYLRFGHGRVPIRNVDEGVISKKIVMPHRLIGCKHQ